MASITSPTQVEPTPEGVPDIKTTDTPARYLAYLARIRPVLLASSRYLAFTSDVGEAFRPVAHPYLVTATYGISWLYCLGDVSFEGYKESKRGGTNQDIAQVVAKRTVFQATASMLLPAFTIHTLVKVASKGFQKWGRFTRAGPTLAGLLMIPALPFMFDHPVEHLLDYVWPETHHHPGPTMVEGKLEDHPPADSAPHAHHHDKHKKE